MAKISNLDYRKVLVYRHRRLDNNQIFYIGIAVVKERPYSKNGRNKFWNNVVSKTNFEVEIIAELENWEEACELEQFLIELYGRKDLGTGNLVNLTNGGDGTNFKIISQETKIKMSLTKKGKKHTKEHCDKISKSRIGKPHPQKGVSVIDISTGIVYDSLLKAAIQFNTTAVTIHRYVNGKRKNKTSLRLL